MQKEAGVGAPDGNTSIFEQSDSIIFPEPSESTVTACMPSDEEHR